MSNLKLWIIIRTLFIFFVLSFALLSCSIDNEYEHQSNSIDKVDTAKRTTVSYPENSENPYDVTGKLYALISLKYLDQEFICTTTESTIAQVESIANLELEYQALMPTTYESPDPLLIESTIALEWNSSYNIDESGLLSPYCKANLISFLDRLLGSKNMEKEVEEICDFILSYESLVLLDNNLSPHERKVILSTTSMARHGIYFAKRRPKKNTDRDWEISWGNIYAALDGSKESSAKSIIMSVTAGIITNK